MYDAVLIGLDLGTQGVRAIAATPDGAVLEIAHEKYDVINIAQDPLKEQDALHWRKAAFTVLSQIASRLKHLPAAIPVILAVDGTSGTILPIDSENRPLRTALMYNDNRAKSVVGLVHEKAAALEEKMGYRMSASFGLSKICWIQQNQPEIYEKTAAFVHQSDYVVGCLTGNYQITDYSNALKTGYDLLDDCWPETLLHQLGISPSLLPEVLAPGQPIGPLTQAALQETGLPPQTSVVAGCTDGYASCVAAGVVEPGQYNTTIGTTLVLKGVTRNFIKDSHGRVYCHKHPGGYWYPGGAGNVGGLCLTQWFGPERFAELNKSVPQAVPTGNLIYPLTTQGERFPFVCPEANGFSILQNDSEIARYAGTMEGVGYVERLCYDTLESLGCDIGKRISIAGGAVKSPEWSQIRANILGKKLVQPKIVEAAFGSAMLAGTTALKRTLIESARQMVTYIREFEPDMQLHDRYNELYERFLTACRERNYIDEHL